MTHHHMPPALVESLDNTPAELISQYLRNRLRVEELYKDLDANARKLKYASLSRLDDYTEEHIESDEEDDGYDYF